MKLRPVPKKLHNTVHRLAINGVGQKRTARLVGISRWAVRRILNGEERVGVRVADWASLAIAKNSKEIRSVRPPQLKQLNPQLHKQFKRWVETLGSRNVAIVTGIDEARVWPLIRGTDKHGAADVIEKLNTRLAEVAL